MIATVPGLADANERLWLVAAMVAGCVAPVILFVGKTPPSPEDREEGRAPPPTSDATRVFGIALVGLTVIFGLYMISHGQTTPGGGFQGGVILATAPLSVYLCAEAKTFQRIARRILQDPEVGLEWVEVV